MTCPFPNDRWKVRLFGIKDENRDWRKSGLDGWFKELVRDPRIILDMNIRNALFEFLEVENHKGVADSISSLTQRGASQNIPENFQAERLGQHRRASINIGDPILPPASDGSVSSSLGSGTRRQSIKF